MPPKFYRIESHEMTPWGGYGDILQHGMTGHRERKGGLLCLERTGPYIPPITFPDVGVIVLTSAGRALLETSSLSGFGFQPVHKTGIVDLPWHEWDLTADDPPEYPESGEPVGYILERPSSSRVARQMGDIWELVVPVAAKIGRQSGIVRSFREMYVELDSWNGADIFRGDGYGAVLVTEPAKLWLQEHFEGYVEFQEFNCK